MNVLINKLSNFKGIIRTTDKDYLVEIKDLKKETLLNSKILKFNKLLEIVENSNIIQIYTLSNNLVMYCSYIFYLLEVLKYYMI